MGRTYYKKQFHRSQIGRAQRYMRTHFVKDLTIEEISKEAGASAFHFGRLFMAYTDETPFDFLRRIRILTALQMLQDDPKASMTDIGLAVGYATPSAFNKVFKKLTQISPTQFRNLGKETQFEIIYLLSKPNTEKEMKMSLDPKYKIVHRESVQYVYLEARGPFQETAPPLWEKIFPAVFSEIQLRPSEFLGLSLVDKDKHGEESLIYQAGMTFIENLNKNIKGLQIKKIPKGQYASFTLKGSYSQIWKAFNEIFKILSEDQIKFRKEFCIENYVNDPKVTPEDQLITEILVPVEQ